MSVEYVIADCLEWLPTLPDNSVDLIIADPPYNIKKDHWDDIENYIPWCLSWIEECCRVLKDNGSFYIFHSEMPIVAELMIAIREQTELCFKQFIVWNKRFDGAKNKGFLDGFVVPEGLRNYQQMAEYVLFYTFQDATGLDKVKLDVNNFQTLRQYFKEFQEALGVTKKEIIESIGQCADHCFRWGSTQWDLPTPETYAELCKLPLKSEFIRREYEDLRREYEDLRREYEDLRYPFNNLKEYHSVWNYEIEQRNGHATPKPKELIKNIILHSPHPNHLVLDPFLGSGTTLRACLETGRNGIGCEKNIEYEPIIKERIRQANIPLTQFMASDGVTS